jgi:hypothetical protein
MFCGPVFGAMLFPKFVSRISALISSIVSLIVFILALLGLIKDSRLVRITNSRGVL